MMLGALVLSRVVGGCTVVAVFPTKPVAHYSGKFAVEHVVISTTVSTGLYATLPKIAHTGAYSWRVWLFATNRFARGTREPVLFTTMWPEKMYHKARLTQHNYTGTWPDSCYR